MKNDAVHQSSSGMVLSFVSGLVHAQRAVEISAGHLIAMKEAVDVIVCVIHRDSHAGHCTNDKEHSGGQQGFGLS